MESGKDFAGSCPSCRKWKRTVSKGISECCCFESVNGFVQSVFYYRPESTKTKPCPEWEENPRKQAIEPYVRPPYNNKLIFTKEEDFFK